MKQPVKKLYFTDAIFVNREFNRGCNLCRARRRKGDHGSGSGHPQPQHPPRPLLHVPWLPQDHTKHHSGLAQGPEIRVCKVCQGQLSMSISKIQHRFLTTRYSLSRRHWDTRFRQSGTAEALVALRSSAVTLIPHSFYDFLILPDIIFDFLGLVLLLVPNRRLKNVANVVLLLTKVPSHSSCSS